MKRGDSLKRKILSDFSTAMIPTVAFYMFNEIAAGILTVYTAGVLGALADAVFKLDLAHGLVNIRELIICILITVFIIPFMGMIGEILMFECSLKHDRLVLGKYLDKTYGGAMIIDAGEAQYRLENDPNAFRCEAVDLVTKIIVTPVTAAFLMFNALRINLIYTVTVILISLIKLAVPVAVRKLQAMYDRESRDYNTIVRKYETEIAVKPYAVTLCGLTKALICRLDAKFKDYYRNVLRKSVKCSVIADNISGFLDTFCYLSILLIGALMISKNTVTAGAVAAMTGYFSVFNTVAGNTAVLIKRIPVFRNIVERMKLLYGGSEDMSGELAADVCSITADGFSFSYDGDNNVIDNLSFEIFRGKKTVITGENGSGKSTFIKLLCGLLKNYSGSLKIGGTELSKAAPESWRNQFAYASQEPYLFEGSVFENVHLGNLSASDDEVKALMEDIGIVYLADRVVSMRGNDLSGGEKQKISIARAMLKDTPFLFLDEPSNNLDDETKEWLRSFILNTDKTIVFISHDKALIDAADSRIIFTSPAADK